jgi:hypothetical protein
MEFAWKETQNTTVRIVGVLEIVCKWALLEQGRPTCGLPSCVKGPVVTFVNYMSFIP